MKFQDRKEFVVFQVSQSFSEMDLSQKTQMGHELPQPDFGDQRPDLSHGSQSVSMRISHFSRPPMRGEPAKALGNLPTTSAEINVRGSRKP
ncbi:MAG: hypothetical protein ACK5TO_18595 [Planctomycetaceae bacterium]